MTLDLVGWCVLGDKAAMRRVSFEQREVEPTVTISIFAVPVKAVANITQQRTAFRIVIIDVTAVLGQCFNDCFVTTTKAVSITTITGKLNAVRSQQLTARINWTLCRSWSSRRNSNTCTTRAAWCKDHLVTLQSRRSRVVFIDLTKCAHPSHECFHPQKQSIVGHVLAYRFAADDVFSCSNREVLNIAKTDVVWLGFMRIALVFQVINERIQETLGVILGQITFPCNGVSVGQSHHDARVHVAIGHVKAEQRTTAICWVVRHLHDAPAHLRLGRIWISINVELLVSGDSVFLAVYQNHRTIRQAGICHTLRRYQSTVAFTQISQTRHHYLVVQRFLKARESLEGNVLVFVDTRELVIHCTHSPTFGFCSNTQILDIAQIDHGLGKRAFEFQQLTNNLVVHTVVQRVSEFFEIVVNTSHQRIHSSLVGPDDRIADTLQGIDQVFKTSTVTKVMNVGRRNERSGFVTDVSQRLGVFVAGDFF